MSSLLPTSEEARPTTATPAEATRSLRHLLLYGGATIGIAVCVERALGFLSAMLAARVGGPQRFGAYAMVLATAGTMAAYAGAGIGTTANRFSGQYPRGNPGYRGFLRALMIISLLSATVAAALMFASAGPLAHWMLRNDGLASFLRLAALSSAVMVLLECCRGLLIGQQKFYSLLVVSLISGAGLVVVLPIAARVSPGAMVAGQGCVALLAVLCCVAFSHRLGIAPSHKESSHRGPGLKQVFMFGLIQFMAVAGISIASWWIASLVARSDTSLTQMGIYAVANQFRGLAAIAPGLFTQVGYSLLTDETGSAYGGPNRVMLTNTLLTTSLVVMIAGLAVAVGPWLLLIAYGRSFMAGAVPMIILLATGIVHMSGVPAAHRLSITGLRATGIINTIWAILIVVLGICLVPGAGATGAALAFLIAHAAASLMVFWSLARQRELPGGYVPMFILSISGALALAGLGYWRAVSPTHNLVLTAGILALWGLLLIALWQIGARLGFAPLTFARVFQFRKRTLELAKNDLARP